MQKIMKLLCCLVCLTILTSCGGTSQNAMSKNSKVDIYFVDSEMMRLVPVELPVKKMSAQKTANFVIDELIKGRDDNKKIRRLIPNIKGCVKVKLKHDTAYVDLSEQLVQSQPDGRDLEILTVYQIVNSLTSVEGIETVKFTIAGEEQENFKGFIDMRETFIPDYMV